MSVKKKNKSNKSSMKVTVAAAHKELGMWLTGLFSLMLIVIPVAYSTKSIEPVVPIRHLLLAVFSILLSIPFILKKFRKVNLNFPTSDNLIKLFFGVSLFFGLWCIATMTQAANEEESLYFISRYFLVFIATLLAIAVFYINKDARVWIPRLLVILAGFHGMVGILQHLGSDAALAIPGVGIPYGFNANSNLYGSAMAFLFPFALFTALVDKNKLWKTAGIIIALIAITGVFVSRARSSWLAVIFTLLVMQVLFWLYSGQFEQAFKKFWIRASLIALLLIPVGFGGLYLIDGGKSINTAIHKIEKMFSGEKESSAGVRLSAWYISNAMIKQYPVLGVGAGNWRLNAQRYGIGDVSEHNRNGSQTFVRAHNDYVQFASELGVFGLCLYLSIWFLVIKMGVKSIKSVHGNYDKLLVITLISVLAGCLVDMFFSFPHERIEHNLFRLTAFGGIIAIYLHSLNVKDKVNLGSVINKKAIKYGLFPALTFFLLFNVFFGTELIRFQEHMKFANAHKKANQFQKVVEECEKAKSSLVTLGPIVDPIELFEAIGYKGLKQYDKALDAAFRAKENHPYSARVYNTIGTIYTETSQFQKAIDQYEEAMTIVPEYDVVMMNLGINYYNMQRYKEAYEMLSSVNLEGNQQLIDIYEYSKNYVLTQGN